MSTVRKVVTQTFEVEKLEARKEYNQALQQLETDSRTALNNLRTSYLKSQQHLKIKLCEIQDAYVEKDHDEDEKYRNDCRNLRSKLLDDKKALKDALTETLSKLKPIQTVVTE
jgi:hypothetical protein